MFVKLPPTKILPSGCTAIESTSLSVRVRVERISRSGRGVEPGDAVARLSADVCERTADQNLAVLLHRDRIDIIVRVRVESHVERAVRIQTRHVVAGHAQNCAEDRRR